MPDMELANQKDSITHKFSAEEVASFLENSLGETIRIEVEDNGRGERGTARLKIFLVKILSVTVAKTNSNNNYLIHFHTEGRDKIILHSAHPFRIQKCVSPSGHLF